MTRVLVKIIQEAINRRKTLERAELVYEISCMLVDKYDDEVLDTTLHRMGLDTILDVRDAVNQFCIDNRGNLIKQGFTIEEIEDG